MFTGIIEETAIVQEVLSRSIVLSRPEGFDDLSIGCSIAVSGVCLSVTSFDESVVTFDLAETTKEKTTLSTLEKGSKVNLERAMKAGGRFEGHIVQGHIEGVGEVVSTPVEHGNAVYRGIENFKYPVKSVVGNARGMRKNPTTAEKALWEALRKKQFNGYYFRRQRPIGNFILDFYCEELRLGIEVDGKYHEDPELKDTEKEREDEIVRRGVRILRVTNDEVLNTIDGVLEQIEAMPPPPTPPPFRGRGEGEGACAELLKIRAPEHLLPYIVSEGSITIDGVSLTVADLNDDHVTVALIPITQKETTLGSLKVGDHVNIETDILAKYLLKHAS